MEFKVNTNIGKANVTNYNTNKNTSVSIVNDTSSKVNNSNLNNYEEIDYSNPPTEVEPSKKNLPLPSREKVTNVVEVNFSDGTQFEKMSASEALSKMEANSSAWWDAKASGNQMEMDRLHAENEYLSKIASPGSTYSSDGTWSNNGEKLYTVNAPTNNVNVVNAADENKTPTVRERTIKKDLLLEQEFNANIDESRLSDGTEFGNYVPSSKDVNKGDIPSYADIEAQMAELDKKVREEQNKYEGNKSKDYDKGVTKVFDTVDNHINIVSSAEVFGDNTNATDGKNIVKIDVPDYGKTVAELEHAINDKMNYQKSNPVYIPDYDRVVTRVARDIENYNNRQAELKANDNKVNDDVGSHSSGKFADVTSSNSVMDRLMNGEFVNGYEIMAANQPTADDYVVAGASLANGVLSLAKGSGKFFESLGDALTMAAGGVMTVFTGAYDLGKGAVTGNLDWSTTSSLWNNVIRPTVEPDDIDYLDKQLGVRQKLDDYSLIKSDGAAAAVLENIGYFGTGIALTAATAGAAGVSNVPLFTLGKDAVTMAVKVPAAINAGYALVAGIGKNTSEAWNSGAGTAEGIGYGSLKATAEAASMFVGQGINGLKIAQGAGLTPQILNSLSHVGLDMVTGGLEAAVEPAIEYKSDEEKRKIAYSVATETNVMDGDFKEWKDLSALEKYTASFNYNGGFNNVLNRVITAGVLSAASEIPEVTSVVKASNIMSDINANGITKGTISEIQSLKGNSFESFIGQARESGKLRLVFDYLSKSQIKQLDDVSMRRILNDLYNELDDNSKSIVDLFNKNIGSYNKQLEMKIGFSKLDEDTITRVMPFLNDISDIRAIYDGISYNKTLKSVYLLNLSDENLEKLVKSLPRSRSYSDLGGLLDDLSEENIRSLLKRIDVDTLLDLLRCSEVAKNYVSDADIRSAIDRLDGSKIIAYWCNKGSMVRNYISEDKVKETISKLSDDELVDVFKRDVDLYAYIPEDKMRLVVKKLSDDDLVNFWHHSEALRAYISDVDVEKAIKRIYPNASEIDKNGLLNVMSEVCNYREKKILDKLVDKKTYNGISIALYGDDHDVLQKRLERIVRVIDKMSAGGDTFSAKVDAKLLSVTDEIRIFDSPNSPHSPFWQLKFNDPNHFGAAYGGYGAITLCNNVSSDEWAMELFRHESAHNFDRLLTGRVRYWSDNGLWQSAIDADLKVTGKISVTDYGKNSLQEDFAESMQLFLADTDGFMAKFPTRGQVLMELCRQKLLN